MKIFFLLGTCTRLQICWDGMYMYIQRQRQTYSTENSFSLTGLQKTNCIADQILWNSWVSSICITPFSGGPPDHTGASRNDLILVSTISNIDSPQQSLSLVNKSPEIVQVKLYHCTDIWLSQSVVIIPKTRQWMNITTKKAEKWSYNAGLRCFIFAEKRQDQTCKMWSWAQFTWTWIVQPLVRV